MRKIYFAALGMMLAGTAFAAENVEAVALEAIMSSQKQQIKVAAKDRARAGSMITAPQGRQVVTEYTGQGWYQGVQYLTAGKMEGISDVVWDDANNKVYIHTPIGAITDGYVVGDVSADGTKITVQLPQQISEAVMQTSGKGYPMYLSVMKKTTDPNLAVLDPALGYSFIPVEAEKNIVEYTITEEGNIVMTSPAQDNFDRDANNYVVFPEEYLSCYVTAPKSVFYDLAAGETDKEINEWFYYGNINQTIALLPEDVVKYDIPANLKWQNNWSLAGKNTMNTLCKVAIDGDKLYVGSIVEENPAVLVGLINDNKVTFKNNQLLGYDDYSGSYLFLQSVSIEDGVDELGPYLHYTLINSDMVFDWDREENLLTFQGTQEGMLINYGMKKGPWYYAVYKEPTLRAQTQEGLCVVPPTPKISQYYPASDTQPILVMAVIPREAENGMLLSYDNLAFRIFLDGELLTFTKSDYGLSKDMTEIPCNFKSSGISANGREIIFRLFEDGMRTISIQSINNAPDGKQYFSLIHTYELGPDGIIDPEGVIEDNVGLTTVIGNAGEGIVRYYDIQGRPVAEPKQGQLLIKVETYKDGTVRATKEVR